jgi:hypothetical protein
VREFLRSLTNTITAICCHLMGTDYFSSVFSFMHENVKQIDVGVLPTAEVGA